MKNLNFASCSGGCTQKLGPDFLHDVLSLVDTKMTDENLLIGFNTSDDAAVYKLTEELAIVQTLDFFTPMVDEPYIFGQIAAANALSDIYAMGGEVKTALNIVCFPENMDKNVLVEILKGGAEKVSEAGGVLCGGHSINDNDVKYGLSVTGIVNPKNVKANNSLNIGDKLILTKPLGVSIVLTAKKMGEASQRAYEAAVSSMTTLNKYAAQIMYKYDVSACTDVTGFSFLGHLSEMISPGVTALIYSKCVPVIEEAYEYAKEFFITSAGQRNRNFLKDKVLFENVPFEMEEILFDPQTSGGLLIAVKEERAGELLKELNTLGQKSAIVGEVTERNNADIIVKGD